ncbi:MAG: family 1 glycosylhydrolase [Actinomycetota bacterium]|nr:family 1 glycosylhydrolase [Actinomycetota bacterium]
MMPSNATSSHARRIELVGAFESTYLPGHDTDIIESSGHARRWREDLELMRELGVTRLRYPIRWHRVEPAAGRYDWRHTDEVMRFMRDEGLRPIVDLVHHTSYPRWLRDGFADPRFGAAYVAYADAVADRYPWIAEYTAFNEPFATLFLSGHDAVWPPFHHGVEGLVGLLRNVLPAIAEVTRRYRERLPGARHVWVDSCEGHAALDDVAEDFAAYCDDRRFIAIDAILGRAGDRDRPFVEAVVRAGGADLLELEPGHVDVLGLDYYAHHEWCYRARTTPLPPEIARRMRHPHGPGHPQEHAVEGVVPSLAPRGLAALAGEYSQHVGLPMILGETNIRGATSDRATWLKHTLEQCEQARAAGVPIDAYCWFGLLDSLDWISLLERCDREIDPVGVFGLDADLRRIRSSMSRAFALAAEGRPAAELPAYRLTPEVAAWTAQLAPLMAHFEWIDPPRDEVAAFARAPIFAAPDPIAEEAAA